eukprot:SAG31_NODE_7_length_42755_cov_130.245728_28_plen_80_part_00
MFGASIVDEYKAARDQMGLSDALLAECARNSFLYSGLALSQNSGGNEAKLISTWLGEVDAWGKNACGHEQTLSAERHRL